MGKCKKSLKRLLKAVQLRGKSTEKSMERYAKGMFCFVGKLIVLC